MCPVFYTDVTDSWRLSEAGRLRTDLGGVYFNVLFALTAAGQAAADRHRHPATIGLRPGSAWRSRRSCVTGAVTVDSAPVVEVVVGVEPVTVAVTLGRGCVTRAVSVDNAPSVVAGLVGVIVLVTPLVGEFVVELVERVAKLVVGAELANGAVVAERICLTGSAMADTAALLVVGVVELVVGALELAVGALELGVVELLVGAELASGAVVAERVCLTGAVTVDTAPVLVVGVVELVARALELGVVELLVGAEVEVFEVTVGVLELVVEELEPLVGVPELVGVPVLVVEVIDVMVGVLELVVEALKPLVGVP